MCGNIQVSCGRQTSHKTIYHLTPPFEYKLKEAQ